MDTPARDPRPSPAPPAGGAPEPAGGVALFRAGRWQESAETLARGIQLAGGGGAVDGAVMAMALQHLGRHDEARGCLARARAHPVVRTEFAMDDPAPFVAEAEALLGGS